MGNQLSTYYLNKKWLTKRFAEKKTKENKYTYVAQVWGIAKRKFKDDFKRRTMTFDSLVFGVMMYGIELMG